MAAAPELLKVVNLIMKRQQLDAQDVDSINERQFRKMAEIDIDEKVKCIKLILAYIHLIPQVRFTIRLKHGSVVVNYPQS